MMFTIVILLVIIVGSMWFDNSDMRKELVTQFDKLQRANEKVLYLTIELGDLKDAIKNKEGTELHVSWPSTTEGEGPR